MSELSPALPDSATRHLIEIHITVPGADDAQRLAAEIIDTKLAACAQLLGPMTSVFSWEGKPHQATEWLLLVKTTEDLFGPVSDLVSANHRYDVPEVVAVPISHTLTDFGAWVRDSVRPAEV